MTRDTRRDELDRFDDVELPKAPAPAGQSDVDRDRQSEIARETTNDKDEDGLPDEPAKYRVPS